MTSLAVFIASAVFVQTISAQCFSNIYGPGMIANNRAIKMDNMAMNLAPLPYQANNIYGAANPMAYDGIYGPVNPIAFDGFNQALTLATLAASNCNNFAVKSSSLLTPSGVSLTSENLVIEGPLAVNGQLPFLGTISLEGSLPAAGNGAVAYGGGNGNIAIMNEDLPFAPPMNYLGAPVYGPGLPGPYNYNGCNRGVY
ncbi:unnamed protein product [Danaus chrysippus]|uniref:(African queen) hypothetical protein n=1 Tax=Danaus chrysippus TaxID=151541 RepID=A0A8J2R063_9NEOP|nr:unnamed protein product [Danaus chrysippus]